MYDALLLDHDGVLVGLLALESIERGIRHHGEDCFRELGVEPDDRVIDTLSVGAERSVVAALADEFGADAGRLWRCRDDAVERTLRRATRDGEKEPYADVAALDRIERPLGVVSNNQRRLVEFVLRHHGLWNLFGTVWAREPTLGSLERKKPAPTYLEGAMADLGVERPLYVGDSETDVVAARRAGVDCLFLRREHNADVTLSTAPTAEVSGLDEVVAVLRDGPRIGR